MKKTLLKILDAPWYFIAFAAYPVLAFLSYNISQVRYTAGIRPLIISFVVATLLFLLFRLIYKNWRRAAFAAAAFTVLFYTYYQVFDQIQKKWKASNLPLWLGALWVVLLILALVGAGWRKTQFQGAALTLNLPVIIIQDDHGSWLQSGSDQFKILNVYYLSVDNGVLYPGISPVNIFQLILNTYLGVDYPLMKNISYDSPVPYVLISSRSPIPVPENKLHAHHPFFCPLHAPIP